MDTFFLREFNLYFVQTHMNEKYRMEMHENKIIQNNNIKKICFSFTTNPIQRKTYFFYIIISLLYELIQKVPNITKAKKAISNFNIKKKQKLGIIIALRGTSSLDFLYFFINSFFSSQKKLNTIKILPYNKNYDLNLIHILNTIEFEEHLLYWLLFLEQEKLQINLSLSFNSKIVLKNIFFLTHFNFPICI